MYKNIDVQRKVFLIEGNGCIVFVNIKDETEKEKERKTSKVDMLWLGRINHS